MKFKNISSDRFILERDAVYYSPSSKEENGLYINGRRYTDGDDASFLTNDEVNILREIGMIEDAMD